MATAVLSAAACIVVELLPCLKVKVQSCVVFRVRWTQELSGFDPLALRKSGLREGAEASTDAPALPDSSSSAVSG